jgi:predicted nucleic acid-binding protein
MAGAVRIVDTSVLCNILRVPNMDQERTRAEAELREALRGNDVLLLPVAVIYETGNHIAQNGDGRVRRAIAGAFVELVQKAFSGEVPFTPTPLHDAEDMLEWVAQFPGRASEGVGFGDLSLTRIFDRQCELNAGRRVLIWSYDRHLQGFDRAARL